MPRSDTDNRNKYKVKDSSVLKIVERVPILGFVASAGHGLSALVTGKLDDVHSKFSCLWHICWCFLLQ